MVAPAAFSVHRTQSLPSKEMNAISKTGGDEPAKDDELMKDAESEAASTIVSRKRTTRDDEDAEELDVSEEREAKKRRVASGITLVDLKINIVLPPTEPAPIVEFEPTVVDDADTEELDRQIARIEKELAEAMKHIKPIDPLALAPSTPSESTISTSVVAPEHQPVRSSPLKCFTVTKPGMLISQFCKPIHGAGSAPRVSSSAPSMIVPPSLPVPVVEQSVVIGSGKPVRPAARPASSTTASPRRSRRLSSLPPIDTKPRRASPPPRDSLYRQALVNRMRIAARADDFGSPTFSPPSLPLSLPAVADDDSDMEQVDTDSARSTPSPEPVDPRLFPRQGCLKQMKAEHERRRMEKDLDCDLSWFAAKLEWEMGRKNAVRRRRCY